MNFQVVIDELLGVITGILHALPGIINGLLLFVIGYLLARVVRFVLRFVLERVGFDALMEEIGLSDGLRGIGITARLSRLIAQVAFALLLLSFSATAARVMGIVALAALLEQILNYLPSLIGAALVFLFGSLAARYIGEVVSRVARSNGITYASTLGRLLQYLILIFVVVLAVGSLGIDTTILVTILTIGGAGFALALGLSFGLGARHLVRDILSSYYVRERFPVGRSVTFGEVHGEVRGLGSVNTVIDTAEASVVVPNSMLIRSVVQRGPTGTTTPPPEPPTPEQ